MRKDFREKVMKMGTVDTAKYRYTYTEMADRAEIKRIEIEKLDTTEAIDGWEVIEVIQ